VISARHTRKAIRGRLDGLARRRARRTACAVFERGSVCLR
jgi:hypothetical protein